MPRPKVTELDPEKLAAKYFTQTWILYAAITEKMELKRGLFRDTSAHQHSAEAFKKALVRDLTFSGDPDPTPETTLPFFKRLAENLTPAGFTYLLTTLRNRRNSQNFRIETRYKTHVHAARHMLKTYGWTVNERDKLAIGVLEKMITYYQNSDKPGNLRFVNEAESLIREAMREYEEKKKVEANEAKEGSE